MYELGQLRDDPANLAMEYPNIPCNDVPDNFSAQIHFPKKAGTWTQKIYISLSLSLSPSP